MLSKEIDISKAQDWDEQELAFNVKYLESRGMTRQLSELREVLELDPGQPLVSGGQDGEDPHQSPQTAQVETPKEEEDDEEPDQPKQQLKQRPRKKKTRRPSDGN